MQLLHFLSSINKIENVRFEVCEKSISQVGINIELMVYM